MVLHLIIAATNFTERLVNPSGWYETNDCSKDKSWEVGSRIRNFRIALATNDNVARCYRGRNSRLMSHRDDVGIVTLIQVRKNKINRITYVRNPTYCSWTHSSKGVHFESSSAPQLDKLVFLQTSMK
jgi:hypothetical protein